MMAGDTVITMGSLFDGIGGIAKALKKEVSYVGYALW